MGRFEDFMTTDVHVWLGVGLAAALILLAYTALFLFAEGRNERNREVTSVARLERRRRAHAERPGSRRYAG